MQNSIKSKDSEINELKYKLSKINNINNNKKFNREDIKCVNFASMDQAIHYSIPCIASDTFAEVEELLYKQFPEYRETNNYFVANGKEILRFKTISENNIKNGFPIMLLTPDK